MGTHSKKKPHNLIIGRLFDNKVLDMAELGVENFKSSTEFKSHQANRDMKPCLIFQGDQWESSDNLGRLKNLFIDFFRIRQIEQLNIQELKRVIAISALDETRILFRQYETGKITEDQLTKGNPEISEIGPSMDLVLRRINIAAPDLYKQACKQPKLEKSATQRKNLKTDILGQKRGRIHLGRQDLSKILLKRTVKRKKLMRDDPNNLASEEITTVASAP